jgi:hypothetical protein
MTRSARSCTAGTRRHALLPRLDTLEDRQLLSTGARLYANVGSSIVSYDTTATMPTPTTYAGTGMDGPDALVLDAAGKLYVANSGDHTIEKFTLGGAGTVFATPSYGPISGSPALSMMVAPSC